jgi:fumarylpyruvate hydrolase
VAKELFTLPRPAVPMAGEDAVYPVRRIFCVARNYAGHAREMGADPSREPPFFFSKSPDSLVPGGGAIPYAPATRNLHHEVELVVALGTPLFRATPEDAVQAVLAQTVGLDMTRRDLQLAAKDQGRPWDFGKSFEASAPIAPLVRCTRALEQGAITLAVNGAVRQSGDLSDMIWSVPEVLAHLSQYYHLGPGDLVFTGTPEGVGAVVPGDRLDAAIAGLAELSVTIAAAG